MTSKIDLTDVDDFTATMSLLDLLLCLKLATIEEVIDAVQIDYTCRYCDEHETICGCNDDDSRRRYDQYDDESGYED